MSIFGALKLFLKSNKGLASAFVTSYGSMVLSMGIQFVLVPRYLDHMGKDMFGILMIMLAAISYGSIGITWLSGGMARILGERGAINDKAGFAEAYSFSKWAFVVYALMTIAIFWLFAPLILANALQNEEIHQALIFISIYFLLMYEFNTDRLAFNALCRQATGNAIEAAGQVVFALSAAVGLYLHGSLVSVIIALIAGVVSSRGLAWIYWSRQNIALGWRWLNFLDVALMWRRVSGKIGLYYVVYGVLLLTLQADVLFVGWLAGPEVAGDYYLLWRIPEVCILLLGRIPAILAPYFIQIDARGDIYHIYNLYRKGLLIMFSLSALAGLAYGLLGSWFMHLWVGNSAPDGLLPYIFSGMALFFVAAIQWPSSVAYALVNTGPLVKVATLYLFLKLCILVLIFRQLDLLAPLVAIIASHILGIFFLYLKVGKDTCTLKFKFA